MATPKNTRTKNRDALAITETKDFAGMVEEVDGRKRIKILAPVWYQHQVNKFKTGEQVTMYISSRKPKRSAQQNRYYWGIYLPLIEQETGNSIDDLHTLFKGMFLSSGIVKVMGQPVRRVQSTANLSKGEFGEYIDKIQAFTGIEAPPTDNYYIR